MKSLVFEIGAGELFDRLTILELKVRHARNEDQLRRASGELQRARELTESGEWPIDQISQIAPLVGELRVVNERLWRVEDQLRRCETIADFGPPFVELSRAVYLNNDLRAAIKRRIDECLSPSFMQDKIYAEDSRPEHGDDEARDCSKDRPLHAAR